MPGHDRKTNAIRTVRRAARALVPASPLLAVSPALAAPADTVAGFDPGQTVLLAALLGVVGFAVISAIALIRRHNRAVTENAALRGQVASLKASADRAEALIEGEDQRFVAWNAPGEPPLVAGRLSAESGAPADRAGFLAFGTWLQPESAGRLDRAVARLRDGGESFAIAIASHSGRLIDVSGRTVGGSAVVRFRDLTGDRLARAEIAARHDLLVAEVDAMRAALQAAPMPIWLRDDKGRLVWVNAAYAAAVEAKNGEEAVNRGLELLDSAGRRMIERSRAEAPAFRKRLPAVVAGARRIFDVSDVASAHGSAGIAGDVTEIEAAGAALRREMDFHARTLDQLATAVAIVGPDRRLRSYNAAYRALFDLDAGFLDSHPEENAVLDRLRSAHKLPEQADFRSWRADLLSAYRSVEAREQWWHLPDGQTLRVIANPNPQGGMTWIYENVTEKLHLESRYNALIHVQGETLDHLAEGVAVFGSDGRLRLHNPSFAAIFDLDPAFLATGPHVADIVRTCRREGDDDTRWSRFTACVAGLDETRSSVADRMERAGGRVIDYATVPLPDGQTMVTFVDVSDTVKVERALVERNEALLAADSLKNAFIQHVSYELRSPLTNIIGFTQLLTDTRIGPLNPKQREYTGYIMSSSASLLAIVNDILDLATVDAGIMELDYGEVRVADTVAAAIEGLQDRLRESQIRIETHIPADIGSFVADAKRVRQVLFNLLANAIDFSTAGGRVAIAARREDGTIVFSVSDEGPGIPADFIASAFDRFASQPRGAARGGVGLGLAIVKSFVGLHHGAVEILSEEGRGATVICRFPVRPAASAVAAE
jgi:signal transduction histidine kinase